MNDSQTSCMYEVKDGTNHADDASNLTKVIESYFKDRINGIDGRLSEDKRSIFDFVDMAVMIGALANMADAHSNGGVCFFNKFFK